MYVRSRQIIDHLMGPHANYIEGMMLDSTVSREAVKAKIMAGLTSLNVYIAGRRLIKKKADSIREGVEEFVKAMEHFCEQLMEKEGTGYKYSNNEAFARFVDVYTMP